MARRALIIGLGSNGYEVCNRLQQRIQWEYGGLDKTPWVQFLWFETAPFSEDTTAGQNGHHITMSGADFNAWRSQPDTFQDSYALKSWTDPEIMKISNAIDNGASNTRMLGRIAFLHNIRAIRDLINARLNTLRSLTEAAATDARNAGNPSDEPVKLNDKIEVFVVGTLAGGTGSGSFVDLGYLLQSEFTDAGFSGLQRTGIFSIPHPAYTNKKQRANVYSALRELNHFSSGEEYRAQLPFHPGRETIGHDAPYDQTFLVQSPGGAAEDYERLKTSITQYLHTSIFVPDFAAIVGARDNIKGYITQPDRLGAAQPYLTFGISAIEFPAYLIVQACCYRLGVEALNQWLAPRNTADGDWRQIAEKDLRLTFAELQSALERSGTTSLRDQIRNRVAEIGGGEISENALHRGESVLDAAFGGVASTVEIDRTLPPNIAPESLQKNAPIALAEFKSRLENWLQSELLRLDGGPESCRQMLEYLDRWLGARIEKIDSAAARRVRNEGIDGARESQESARDRLLQVQNDGITKMMSCGMHRNVVRRYISDYESASTDYYLYHLQGATEPVEAKVWRDLQTWLGVLSARLGAPSQGLRAQGEALRDLLDKKYRELDEKAPPINGVSVFEVGKTIGEMYARSWRMQSQKAAPDAPITPQSAEAAAKIAFLQMWDALPQRDAATGEWRPFFKSDTAPKAPEQLQADVKRAEETLVPRAREHFRGLLDISLFDEFAPTNSIAVKDALDKSKILLDIDKGNVQRYETAHQKSYAMAFFNGSANAVDAPQTPAGKFAATVQSQAQGETADIRFQPLETRQSAIFLREDGAFSLPLVAGLRSVDNPQTNDFQASYEDESKTQFVDARKDIRYLSLKGENDPQAPQRKARILVALSLPRDANGTRVLQMNRDGFVYELRPPLPPNTYQVSLPRDLKEAARLLKDAESGQVEARLSYELQQVRQTIPVSTLAAAMMTTIQGVEQLRFTDGGPLLSVKAAYQLIRDLYANDPEMWAALASQMGTVEEKHLETLRRETPQPGYYCDGCHAFIGATINEISAKCPGCEKVLRAAS